MPDLTATAVDDWLSQQGSTAIPVASQGDENHQDVLPGVVGFGEALDRALDRSTPGTEAFLGTADTATHLQPVMAHFGPARRLRLLHWLSGSEFTDPRSLVEQVTAARADGSGQSIRRWLLDLQQEDLLRAIFDADRINWCSRLAAKKPNRSNDHVPPRAPTLVALAFTSLLLGAPVAQADETAACTTLAQAAADGLANRIAADDQTIKPPQSVTTLSCLDGFFNGVGLNVITNLLDPTSLLASVKGRICSAVQSTWQSAIGSAQCGLTVTGFNVGFGGLGGGVMCPRLSFGGGGSTIGSIGTGIGAGQSGQFLTGTGVPPTGYPLPTGRNF